MKKIAFFIEQEVSVICSDLDNTACSGTIYSTLLLANEFSKSHSYKVYIFHKGRNEVKDEIEYFSYCNHQDVYSKLKNINLDIFIVSGHDAKIFNDLGLEFNIKKRILWLHNHVNLEPVNQLVYKGHITDIVTVCAYQMGWTLKYNLFGRTRFIYNPYRQIKNLTYNKHKDSSVLRMCFIGALVPAKGIKNLFVVFNSLRDKGVNVHLDIFGSSGLYGNHEILGKTKALSEKLEKEYSDLIFEKNGELKIGLKFHGAVSKLDIISGISNSDVFLSGLNEVGPAECFSISFLDAQSVGVPVYTLMRGGQPETVMDSCGKVFNNISSLINQLAFDFKNGKLKKNPSGCLDFLSPDIISKEWENVFDGTPPSILKRAFSIFTTSRVLLSLLFNGYLKD